METKKQAIFIDAVITESCNLQCSYCRDRLVYDSSEIADVLPRVQEVLKINQIADYDIFKISGYGEITLAPAFSEIIPLILDKRLLVITNGTKWNDSSLETLLKHPDPSLCVSLDGHTIEMNQYRRFTTRQLERTLSLLKTSDQLKLPIEINCVLHKRNIDSFEEYLSFAAQNFGGVMIFPFPVRYFPFMKYDDYAPSTDQVKNFTSKLSKMYNTYSQILPPEQYLDRLSIFLSKGKRSFVCTVPTFVIGVNGTMDVLGCPCGPQEHLGNIKSDKSLVLSNLVKSERGRWPECANCFNHYEVISMYIDNKLSDEDIAKVPSIRKQSILNHLQEIKIRYHG